MHSFIFYLNIEELKLADVHTIHASWNILIHARQMNDILSRIVLNGPETG